MRNFPLAFAVIMAIGSGIGADAPVNHIQPRVVTKETKTVSLVVGDASYELPTTTIIAPEKPVKRGKNIIIGVQTSPGPSPKGFAKVSYTWVISPPVDDLFALTDNTKASFGSGIEGDPDKYLITLVASYVYVDDDGRNPVVYAVQSNREVSILDAGPIPPVPVPPDPVKPDPVVPDPPKPPPVVVDPVLPDGQYKLAAFSYNAAKAAKNTPSDAAIIAGSFRSIISRNAGAAFASPKDLGEATAASTRLLLGDKLPAWAPTLDLIGAETNRLKIGQTTQMMLTAWEEIASGLDAYAKANK